MAQMVCKHKALSSNPIPPKKKKGTRKKIGNLNHKIKFSEKETKWTKLLGACKTMIFKNPLLVLHLKVQAKVEKSE
jgi:hypothetical protein